MSSALPELSVHSRHSQAPNETPLRGITWHGGHSPSTWFLLGVQVSETRMLSVFLQLAASSLGDYRELASPS